MTKISRTKFTKEFLLDPQNLPNELYIYFFDVVAARDEIKSKEPIDWEVKYILEEARYVLSCYYELNQQGDGHILAELKEEDTVTWRQEVKEVKQWIKRMERWEI